MICPFTFGRIVLDVGGAARVLDRGDLTLLAVQLGTVIVAPEAASGVLDARRCALYVDGTSLTLRCGGDATAHVIWCRLHDASNASGTVAARGARTSRSALSDQLERLLLLGLGIGPTRCDNDLDVRDAIGLAVFSTFKDEATRRDQVSMPASLRRVREHVESHFEEPLSLSRLAEIAGVTREHLNATFRRFMGSTPMRYVWNVRAAQAVRLVESTDLNLSIIANRCGYKSPFHLSREIKRLTGSSPREIRRTVENTAFCGTRRNLG